MRKSKWDLWYGIYHNELCGKGGDAVVPEQRMADGADEYEMLMKGQKIWASIRKNSGA